MTTNCPSCGAPFQIDPASGLLICGHCGTEQQPSVLIEPIERTADVDAACPACGTALSSGRLAGFDLLSCARCGGVLVAMSRFVEIIGAMRAAEPGFGPVVLPRQQRPDERRLPCPQCRQPMLSHVYGGAGNVVIETCERCHVNWLDAGEIRRIARAE